MEELANLLQHALSGKGAAPSLVLVGGWVALLNAARRWWYFMVVLSLPGTWLHEMAHLLVGLFLLAKPESLSLWPKREGASLVLGVAKFRNIRIWNAAFVSLAPLLLIFVGLGVYQKWMLPAYSRGDFFTWAVSGYVVASCFFSCVPSSTDFRRGAASFLMYGGLGYLLWKATTLR